MNINDFVALNENEKPLENIVDDGGYTSIFRTIACIGDSLSSGEFETIKEDGSHGYHDLYEYSWGQYIARTCGSKVYNLSRGGMTAKWFLDAMNAKGWGDEAKKAQAYIVALGVNDVFGKKMDIGSIDDISDDPNADVPDTFAGYYGKVLAYYRTLQPDAKFFLMTMISQSNEEYNAKVKAHSELLYKIAERYPNTYVLDIAKYSPMHEGDFRKRFYLNGHLNPMGYVYTAKMVMSYIDYIIRHNYDDFKRVGLIGTDIKDFSK